MRLFGESINLMSMGGLAVAIGLVIDDAVVVVENIHRHAPQEGAGGVGATRCDELIAPVVSSTLTTVVVFVPLGLLSGVVGQFFRALSLTLSAAVLLSLVLALTLIPLLARVGARGAHRGRAPAAGTARWTPRTSRTLEPHPARPVARGRRWPLRARRRSPARCISRRVGTRLPAARRRRRLRHRLPDAGRHGARGDRSRSCETSKRCCSKTPEVAALQRRTGSELGLFATAAEHRRHPRPAQAARPARPLAEDVIIASCATARTKRRRGIEIEFVQLLQDMLGDLEGNPTPIEVKVFGDDPDVLAELAEQVEDALGKIDGVVDVVGVAARQPGIDLADRSAAAGRLGLTVDDVSPQLVGGLARRRRHRSPAARSHDSRARALSGRGPLRSGDAWRRRSIRGADGRSVPLSSARALSSRANGQTVLMRENLRQMALVTGAPRRSRPRQRGRGDPAKLDGMKLPVGYTLEIGGQYAVAAAGVPRAAGGPRDRGGAGVRHPGGAVPGVPAGRR